MEPAAPDLLLAADPDAPGARRLLADWTRAAAERPGVRLLLAGAGLAWSDEAPLRALTERVDVAVCSRNATDAGWRLADARPGIRWSSVATWLAETAPDAALWVALP